MFRIGNLVFCALLLIYLTNVDAARILGLFTSQTKSHLIVHMGTIRPMIERGHDVTIVTNQDLLEPNLKFRHIKINLPPFSMDEFGQPMENIFETLKTMATFPFRVVESNNATINSPEMKKLMDEDEFDLVVLGYFLNDFLIGVAGHFECPLIVNWMAPPMKGLNDMIGNPTEMVYVPDALLGYQQPMDFLHRANNFLFSVFMAGIHEALDYWNWWFYMSNFPSGRYPSYQEMKRNVSLLFVNTYLNQGPIQPNVPALVQLGGIQIKPTPDPLPEDIEKFLNSSTDGAVYFCLGSNLKSDILSPDFIQTTFSVMSKLKYNVIWKWDSEELPGKSPNILFKKWLPQDDILAHPNVKLFITHGGGGGVAEAQYHGVPMLVLPFFADQFANANKVKKDGYGLTLNPDALTYQTLRAAILEILNNPQFKENVQGFSRIFRDRPLNARDTAAFWMEYVIRHRGAKHLQSPAVHLNAFQYYGLDVIAFLWAIIYSVWKTLKFIWRKTIGKLVTAVCKKCRKNRKDKSKKKTQ